MDNRLKRFLSLALAIIMVIGMMPANVVFATGNEGTPDAGQDPAQVEPTTEAPTTEEPAEPEETTVHICAYDTVVIDKEATAREAGQKTLSCVCGASKTEKICADDCQWGPGHEGECEFVCSKNVRCTLNDGHEGLCEAFGGVVLIESADALAALLAKGGIVTLSGDLTLDKTVVIDAGVTVTLDLNGYKITRTGGNAFENLGNLTIKDSDPENKGRVDVVGAGAALLNKGDATINSGRFVSSQGYALDNEANAEMTIVSTALTTGIQNKGEMTITTGHFHNNRDGANVIRNISGDLEINGGTFQNNKSDAATIYVNGQPELVVNDGTFLITKGNPNTAKLIDVQNGASFRIQGGTFNGGFKVGQGASLIMVGGVYRDEPQSGYEVAENGVVTISGGDYIDDNARAFATQHLVSGVVILVNGQEKVKHEGALADVVAKIGVKGYATLASAVTAAKADETIVLVADTTVSSPISINKSLEIDLNGKTVTSTIAPDAELGGHVFRVEDGCASFTLTANDGKIVSQNSEAYGIIEVFTAADVTVNGGTYDFDTAGGAIFKVRAVNSNTYPSLTLNNVKVETNNFVFDNYEAFLQKLTVSGGEFKSTAYGAFSVNVVESASFENATITAAAMGVEIEGIGNTNATATFTNNTINVTNTAVMPPETGMTGFAIGISSKVDAEIKSGTYSGTRFGLTTSGTNLLISGGTFTGKVATHNANGAVRITGGTFNSFGVEHGNGGDLVITGGWFDNDPTNYLEPEYEWKSTKFVGLKDVRVQDTDTAPVQGAERKDIEDVLKEIKYSYALRDNPPTDSTSNLFELIIKLQSIDVAKNGTIFVPTKIVYDVSPRNGSPDKKITFSLPVPSAVTETHVKVYHRDVLMGIYEVQGSGTAKHVRVETEGFSPFTVIPVTNGATAVAYIGSEGYTSLEAALQAAKAADMTDVLVEINGNVTFSAEAANFNKVTFTGVKREMVIDMKLDAAFSCNAELVFNNLTVSRLQGGTEGWRDYHFIAKKGLTYNNCIMKGSFNVSGQNTTFNGCQFNNADTAVSGSYALWLFNSFGNVVNVNNCTFDVLNRAVKMYATNRGGIMTLNIVNTDFEAVADNNNKTVVEMTFENCGGDAIMLLNIDGESTKNDFGTPEHSPKPGEENAWFNSEGKGENEIKGAVVTIDGSVVYNDCEAKIGNQYYTTLQKAINAVKNGETINMLKDTNADVTISQVAGKSFTIDGSLNGFESSGLKKNVQAVFSGTMFLQGNARNDGAETLTIQNIKFATDKTTHDFISCDKTDSVNRYAHNVTVKGCTFECTNEAATNAVVGMRYRQCYNMTVENCTATNMHSLLWATGGNGLTVKNCKSANGTVLHEGGVNVGTTTGAVFENCNFKGKDYGIRADGSAAATLTIKNSNLTADIPVYVRNVTAENYTLVMEGANTLTPTGSKTGIVLNKAATITGEYDAGEQPTVRAIVELNGTGLTAENITGEVQSSGKLHFTIATEAAIGKVYFDKLVGDNQAIQSAVTGDTIDLLCDIETTSMINFSNKAITVNGKPDETAPSYAIKAKADKYWTADRYLVQSTGDITLENIIIDGNNVGCRGIQLNYSGKNAVVLENVTAKNITADKNSCDYAIMSNVAVLTIKGQLKFDGCKYGRLVLGDSRASVATVASGATLTNVKVNLENINIKKQTGSELIVAKNAKYDVQTHVKGHHVEYEDGKYKLKIDNTVVLDNAFAMQDTNRSRIYIELLDAFVGNTAKPAESKITVKLYTADNQLISTTTNIKGSDADLPCVEDVLGVNIVLGGEENSASSSWNTVFEKGHPRADMPASYYKLFLNDNEDPYTDAQFADGKVPVLYTGIADQNPVAWEDLKYINHVINERTQETYVTIEDALRVAQENDTIKLLGNVTEGDVVVIDKKITLDLNDNTVSRNGLTDGYALLNVGAEVTITNGTVKINGMGSAIWANTNSNLTLANVNVEGATFGMQLYGEAEVTVNNNAEHTISGKDAIRVYGGELNVEGGEVTGTDNAIITIGDKNNSNVAKAKVNISGGKITGKIKLDATDATVPEAEYEAAVIITNGEFYGSNLNQNDVSKDYRKIIASGGTYDQEVPITMCKDGYFCEQIANINPVRYHVIENPGCRIDLSAVDADDKVVIGEDAHVDGVAYKVQAGKVIVLDKEMAKKPSMFITTYGYETNNTNDPIDDYPNAMHVWYAVGKNPDNNGVYTSYDVERMEMLDDFFVYEGTSIRVGDKKPGIRFFSSVEVEKVNKLLEGELFEDGSLENAVLTSAGTWFKKTNEARSEVYGSEAGYNFRVFARVEDRNWFTGVLVGLEDKVENIVEPFLTRPYAEIQIEEGKDPVTLYGGILERSIYYVATQNKDSFAEGSSHDDYVENLITMGDDYKAENTNPANS